MCHIQLPAITGLAAVALTCAVAAQPQSNGMFIATPAAMSLAADNLVPFNEGEMYFKQQGFFTGSAPSQWSVILGRPDFRMDAYFRRLSRCPLTRKIDIDATSIGLDWILANDATGQVEVPADRWAALTLSVTPGTVGRRGSVIAQEVARADGAAADLFSYALNGSALPPELVDRTDRAHDSREMDLGDPAMAQRDVDALELFMPLYTQFADFVNLTLPAQPTFYFSVSRATVGNVPSGWWRLVPSGTLTPPSPATILCTTWDARSRTWSCPTPWKTFRELGLEQGEDVDALAIDIQNQRILFSTTTRSRDPLLFLYCGAALLGPPTPVPYMDGAEPVSGKIGVIGDDDFDAICGLDPSVRGRTGPGGNPSYWHTGTPRPRVLPPTQPRISASAFRDVSGGNRVYRSHVLGYPPTNDTAGLAGLFWGLPDLPWPLATIVVKNRNPANPIAGDPVDGEVVIPPVLSMVGAGIDLRWFMLDSAGVGFGEAHPLLVHL